MEQLAWNRENITAVMESYGHMTDSSGNRAGKNAGNGEIKG
jgi:hypothetical protein